MLGAAFLQIYGKLRPRTPYLESSWPSQSCAPVPCQPAWSETSSWRLRWKVCWGGSPARWVALPQGVWAPVVPGSGHSTEAPSLGLHVHHFSSLCSKSAAARLNFSACVLCGTHTFLSGSLKWRADNRAFPSLSQPSIQVPQVATVKMKQHHHCKIWVYSQNVS